MVEAGRVFASTRGVDSIVGLGGGSSLDCAKGINFVLTNGGSMRDYWGFGKASRPMLPMIAIPTTAGTGSEAQSYALISDAVTHVKMACGDPKAAFRAAILDPLLTRSQPREVTATAGYDAISHAVESYVTTRRNTASSVGFAREAWRLLAANFERVLRDPGDLEARGAMLLGAHFAGIAIENSMLGATHACANPLTRALRHDAWRSHCRAAAARGAMEPAGGGRPLPRSRRMRSRPIGSRGWRKRRACPSACGIWAFRRRPSRFGRGSRGPMDRTVQSETVRRRGRARDLPVCVLAGMRSEYAGHCHAGPSIPGARR